MTTQEIAVSQTAGKYLTFVLDGELYGIPILAVREIIAVQPITPLPRMPSAVNGVINLRGKIIPVIDLRTALTLHARDFDRATCIVVMDLDLGFAHAQIGGIVDAVREVAGISEDILQPAPTMGGAIDADYIQALAKLSDEGSVVTLLDVRVVLTELFGGLMGEMPGLTHDEEADDFE